MSVDLTALLQGCQSPDGNIQKEAERQLKVLETSNFPMYVVALTNELQNEAKPSEARQLAGIQLKNSVYAKSRATTDALHERWIQGLDNDTKMFVKNKVLESLGSQDARVQNTAAGLISKIAVIELRRNEWPNLIPLLCNTNLPLPYQKVALDTIQYVCEDVPPNDLRMYSNQILTAVIYGMRSDSPVPVRLSAAHALHSALEFCSDNIENDSERPIIVETIVSTATADDVTVRTAAFECLSQFANLYYNKLAGYMYNGQKSLWAITSHAILNDAEEVGREAVEFWCTICECEMEIQDGFNVRDKNEHFISTVAEHLLDILFQGCTRQDDEYDESATNVAMACGECMKLMAQCVKNPIVPLFMKYVEKFVVHDNWRFREAACLTFGSCLEGPDNPSIQTYVSMGLELFVRLALSDPSVNVRDTAAWTLQRICELHSQIITPQIFVPFLESLLPGLTQVPRVASRLCACIQKLAENAPEKFHSHIEACLKLLFVCGNRQDGDESNLRNAAYEAINAILKAIDRSNTVLLGLIVEAIGHKLQETLTRDATNNKDQQVVQALLVGCLNTACRQAGGSVLKYSGILVGLFHACLNSKNETIHYEALMAFDTIINCLEADFRQYVDGLMPVVLRALSNWEDEKSCSVAVGIVQDLGRVVLDYDLVAYLPNIMPILESNLGQKYLDKWVKPVIIAAYGDIALAIGTSFYDYLERVMQVLYMASNYIPDPTNIDQVEYQHVLFQTIFEACSGIVQGLHDSKGQYQQRDASFEIYLDNFFFPFVQKVATDPNTPLPLVRAAISALGDICQRFAQRLYNRYQFPWMIEFLRKSRNAIREELDQNQDDLSWAFNFIGRCIQF